MSTDQLVSWLEAKLTAHGVKKLLPGAGPLAAAYRRAVRLQEMERRIEEVQEQMGVTEVLVPEDLEAEVAKVLTMSPTMGWDEAVWEVARNKRSSAR